MKQYSSDFGKTFREQMTFFTSDTPKGQKPLYVNVTIQRRIADLNSGYTSWPATAIMNTSGLSANSLELQGDAQIGSENARTFIFPADTDVQEGTDTITDIRDAYNNPIEDNHKYRILNINDPSSSFGGVTLDIVAFCVQE